MHTFVSTGMEVYNSLKHVFVGKKISGCVNITSQLEVKLATSKV